MTLQEFELQLEAAAQEMNASSCPPDRPDTLRSFRRYSNAVALLPATERTKIANIARQIVASFSSPTPAVQVFLEGHADRDLQRERREPGFMARISKNRAASVMRALQDLVGPATSRRIRWSVVGAGDSSLAVPNPRTEAERGCNRRVKVSLEGKPMPPRPPGPPVCSNLAIWINAFIP
ncbi:MAG: OmpA family protein [Candidatus Eremiobacteraeota bacterium]|nr:OmpA family protein [Candidatus Eremiobacteraeota bacterium]